jgi:AraC-like DNA-binding protein
MARFHDPARARTQPPAPAAAPARSARPTPGTQQVVRFSTAGLPAQRRIELWEDHNSRSLIGLGCRTLNDSSLEATELTLQLRDVQIARVTGSPHVVERTQRHVSANPTDAVVVYFTLEGEAFFYHRNGCEILRPGQALLYDADQPFMRGFARGLEELALKVPRRLFEEISGSADLAAPRIFDFRGPGAGPAHAGTLAGLMREAVSAPQHDYARLEAAALELFRGVVGGDAGAPGHLRAAKAAIAQRLHEPRLSADQVASAVGISTRQLSRIFARDGVSVAQFILGERLDAARRRLTRPGTARLPLGQVAAECGFSSQPHFSRAYKERFGISPLQDHRRAGGAAA